MKISEHIRSPGQGPEDDMTDTTSNTSVPPNVDIERWYPSVDCEGFSIAPGDRVSRPTGKKSLVVQGTLMLSPTEFHTLEDGKTSIGKLVIRGDDGKVYTMTKRVRKLRLASIVHIP